VKKRAWILLTCLLVTSTVLASCTGTTTTTTSQTSTPTVSTSVPATTVSTSSVTTSPVTTQVTSSANTPIYGGTFYMLNSQNGWCNSDPTGWDHQMAINLGAGSVWGNPYMEKLLVGDIEKYGPRGNKTFAFDLWEQIPEQYYGGLLAESWEIQTTP
jgi:hypothetical protein